MFVTSEGRCLLTLEILGLHGYGYYMNPLRSSPYRGSYGCGKRSEREVER
jgi:hypothetical protein